MLPRVAPRQAFRLQASPLASSSRLPARNLSSAVSRPSAIALGKRPLGAPLPAFTPLAAVPVRHFSWTPWQRQVPATEATEAAQSNLETTAAAAAGTPAPEATSTASSVPVDTTAAAPVSPLAPSTPTSTSDIASAAADAVSTPVIPPNATLGDLVAANPNVPLDTILDLPQAVYAAASRADLSAIGLGHGNFSFSGWTSDALVGLHNITGLPWWATIALMTGVIRLFVFRVVIDVQKHNVRLQAVQPQITALTERMKESKDDPQAMQVYQTTLKNLFVENQVNPFKALKLPLVQFPVFLCMFYGIRRLAELPFPQLKEGGFGWVTDFTAPDPYWILPITSMLFTNMVIRVGADGTGAAMSTPLGRHMKNIIAVGTLISVPFVARFPSALLWYWTTTNSLTLLQAWLISKPQVKHFFKIPPPPKVAEVPGGPKPDPSLRETFHWVVDSFKDRYADARIQQQRRQAAEEMAALKKGRKAGQQSMVGEVIREKRRPPPEPKK